MFVGPYNGRAVTPCPDIAFYDNRFTLKDSLTSYSCVSKAPWGFPTYIA